MDTFGQRFKRALKLRGKSPQDVEDDGVMSRANVYLWINGTAKPDKITDDKVAEVCAYLRINRDWLLRGRGPIEGGNAASNEDDWSNIDGYAQAVGLGQGAEAQEYAETHKLKFRADSLARKRLKPSALAVMYGAGDSMEPTIKNGDAVLFDTSDTGPRDGSMFVVQWKGEIFVKRAEILDDIVFFKSDNPAGDHQWKKARRMDAARDPISILGRVRWLGSWQE